MYELVPNILVGGRCETIPQSPVTLIVSSFAEHYSNHLYLSFKLIRMLLH